MERHVRPRCPQCTDDRPLRRGRCRACGAVVDVVAVARYERAQERLGAAYVEPLQWLWLGRRLVAKAIAAAAGAWS
jgi:hypothetical protein